MGTGKTTLVRYARSRTQAQDFCCITLNAWQVDYVTDHPLVALVSSMIATSSVRQCRGRLQGALEGK